MLVSLCLSFSWGSLRGQCMVIMDSFALNRDSFSVTNSTHGYVGNYEQVDLSPDWKAARMEWEREEESFRRSPREPQRRHEVPASSTALNRSALRWPDSTARASPQWTRTPCATGGKDFCHQKEHLALWKSD